MQGEDDRRREKERKGEKRREGEREGGREENFLVKDTRGPPCPLRDGVN